MSTLEVYALKRKLKIAAANYQIEQATAEFLQRHVRHLQEEVRTLRMELSNETDRIQAENRRALYAEQEVIRLNSALQHEKSINADLRSQIPGFVPEVS
jgi:chromosome segregation ATPase